MISFCFCFQPKPVNTLEIDAQLKNIKPPWESGVLNKPQLRMLGTKHSFLPLALYSTLLQYHRPPRLDS